LHSHQPQIIIASTHPAHREVHTFTLDEEIDLFLAFAPTTNERSSPRFMFYLQLLEKPTQNPVENFHHSATREFYLRKTFSFRLE
jgi:hypothetical protein